MQLLCETTWEKLLVSYLLMALAFFSAVNKKLLASRVEIFICLLETKLLIISWKDIWSLLLSLFFSPDFFYFIKKNAPQTQKGVIMELLIWNLPLSLFFSPWVFLFYIKECTKDLKKIIMELLIWNMPLSLFPLTFSILYKRMYQRPKENYYGIVNMESASLSLFPDLFVFYITACPDGVKGIIRELLIWNLPLSFFSFSWLFFFYFI